MQQQGRKQHGQHRVNIAEDGDLTALQRPDRLEIQAVGQAGVDGADGKQGKHPLDIDAAQAHTARQQHIREKHHHGGPKLKQRALYAGHILDEPTAPLSDTETKELFGLVKHLRETENIAIIFISHRINEIIQICDNYTVMRNGEIVDTSPVNEKTTTKEIVEQMLGRSFEENFPKEKTSIGEKMFEVDHLSGADGKVDDVSLYVRSGEIVGVAGLVGAGKSELCKTIFGGYKRSHGSVKLNGRELNIRIPTHAVKNRIALVPEERRKEGVLVTENVNFNLSAANLSKYCRASFILKSKVSANAKRFVQELGITTPSIWQIVKNLSGGNQQKVSVGKWLAADCSVYIFDEPTKGVDVGAKREIFHLINNIAKRGNAVIYATCENSEILSITDRVYVMYDGKVMAELVTKNTSEDEIMTYAVGGKAASA